MLIQVLSDAASLRQTVTERWQRTVLLGCGHVQAGSFQIRGCCLQWLCNSRVLPHRQSLSKPAHKALGSPPVLRTLLLQLQLDARQNDIIQHHADGLINRLWNFVSSCTCSYVSTWICARKAVSASMITRLCMAALQSSKNKHGHENFLPWGRPCKHKQCSTYCSPSDVA